jgi:hypothetical protein
MRSDREERIRQRAYQIWQSEGHGHGRQDDHWHQAEREIAAEDAAGSGKAPRRATGSRSASAGKSTAAKSVGAKPAEARAARSRSAAGEMRGDNPAAPKKAATRSRKPAEKS